MPEGKSEKEPFGPEVVHLDGKVAIITGSTTGIGRATALLLAKHGVKIVVYGRHEEELQDTQRELDSIGGEYLGLTADNADEGQILRVFQETRNRFGDIDILINNAAMPAGSVLEMPYDEMLYVMRTNVLGYLVCLREAVSMMRRKGQGHIVNVGSLSAKVRETGSDVYVATKAGIEAMSESLRKVLYQEHIRISLIEPGKVGSNLAKEPPDVNEQVQAEAKGSSLETEDIARAIYFTLTQPERSNVLMMRIAPTIQGL
ncbi:MAG TPA: SDR family NAD(P)-dependent oxidoreductase [Armatimonadota bacterium]|nr:SDR family NAD(P)-dependent oxidoreductase [Armatimonadota bacterium]